MMLKTAAFSAQKLPLATLQNLRKIRKNRLMLPIIRSISFSGQSLHNKEGDAAMNNDLRDKKAGTKHNNRKTHQPSMKWLSWEFYIIELKSFRQEHGHLRVSANFPNKLYEFMTNQRRLYKLFLAGKKSTLTLDQISELNKLGFCWDPRKELWDIRYNQLKMHYEKEGTTNNIVLRQNTSPQLVAWTNHQRYMHYRLQMNQPSTMTTERREALESIGFVWNVHAAEWMGMFEELRSSLQNDKFASFQRKTSGSRLRSWIAFHKAQYSLFNKGKPSILTPEKVEKLKSIEFGVTAPHQSQYLTGEEIWRINFDKWVEYKNSDLYCHNDGTSSKGIHPKKIGNWIRVQKQEYTKFKQGKPSPLTQENINLLLQEGFVFNIGNSEKWNKCFEEWKTYRDKLLLWSEQQEQSPEKNCRPTLSPKICHWMCLQKQLYQQEQQKNMDDKSVLSERMPLLAKEGFFHFSPKEFKIQKDKKKWRENILRLKNFQEKYGDCCVTTKYRSLRLWVIEQCRSHSNGTLSENRVTELENIGLDFNFESEQWNNWNYMFSKMSVFVSEYGHCVIPSNSAAFRSLFEWAQKQRQNRAILTKEQYDSLCNLGWDESKEKAVWKEMIVALRNFSSEHGHCGVPQIYLPYPPLAIWVMQMRQQYERLKSGEETPLLDDSKVEELEKEGFIWDESAREWEIRYKELVDFSLANGHCSVPLWYPLNPPLGHWVTVQQRQLDLMRKGLHHKLSERSATLLEKIGL